MPEAWNSDAAKVLEADIEPPFQQGLHFAAQHQALRATGARPIFHIMLGEVSSIRGVWMSGEHQAGSVILDMRSDRNHPHEFLHLTNTLSIQDILQRGQIMLGR